MKTKKLKIVAAPAEPLKIDFGCGPNKRAGFFGVDSLDFPGVDLKLDVGKAVWPWANESVGEAHASHFVEHLTAAERIHFINELWRTMKPGGTCTIIVPHWASCRAYGDLTHQWPPVSEFWFYYLAKDWRAVNAPHSNYSEDVNFQATWGYSVHPSLQVRNEERQQYALQNYKEAAQDIIATLTKPIPPSE